MKTTFLLKTGQLKKIEQDTYATIYIRLLPISPAYSDIEYLVRCTSLADEISLGKQYSSLLEICE